MGGLMGDTIRLDDPLRFQRAAPPCAVVIFGANGDLTKRKLVPALYRLAYEGRLPEGFAVLGTSRTALSDDGFRAKMREAVEEFLENSPFDAGLWERFARGLFYEAGDVSDAGLYARMGSRLAEIEAARGTGGNALFYLSTQPSYYAVAAEMLAQGGLARDLRPGVWRRLVVEKPFGHDRASAAELNGRLRAAFPEREIYRIDHYLGKETVQNRCGTAGM
jgi:glucose-6-phosphate 1-dehydrogenase